MKCTLKEKKRKKGNPVFIPVSTFYTNNTCHNGRRKSVPMFSAAPFSGQYNVTTLEKAMVKIYVWVSISSAFHSIVQQKWEQSGEEREKAKRLFDLEKIRNKSSTLDIFHELHFYFNLLTHVPTLVNCKPRTRCQENIRKMLLMICTSHFMMLNILKLPKTF